MKRGADGRVGSNEKEWQAIILLEKENTIAKQFMSEGQRQ